MQGYFIHRSKRHAISRKYIRSDVLNPLHYGPDLTSRGRQLYVHAPYSLRRTYKLANIESYRPYRPNLRYFLVGGGQSHLVKIAARPGIASIFHCSVCRIS